MSVLRDALNSYFKLEEKGTTVKTEFIGGLTTFMAMAYIIFVVPSMLADAGMPKDAAVTANIVITAVITLGMGLWANFPVAVAPGMGITAFFAYYVCGVMGLPWQTGLGAVFISGVLFLILTVTRLRQLIIDSVPMDMKYAIVVGIGMFIAFIGLKNCGIIVANNATFVTLGDLTQPGALLAIIGVFIIGAMMARNVAGAILIGILLVTLLGMGMGAVKVPASLSEIASLNVPSMAPLFLEMDIMAAVGYGLFSIVFTLTIVDLFDNIGTLIGLSRKANLMDKDGHIAGLDKALITDSIGTMASACVGTTTATSYIESAAGIAAGGRTGLTAVFVALLFLVSLIFAPLVGIVPAFATAPALIIVGALMMQEVVHIKFDDFTIAVPAFLTIIMMPLTYSIASGFGFGFISYALMKTLSGRYKEVSAVMWVISICFAINFFLRLH
ncbi:NCS2 family permease [Desulfovibrio sp. OttesenSCG-928-G15]|nr:NCS2 family permease [Desulfovibrio sp. OttesenSCG-928-G15]